MLKIEVMGNLGADAQVKDYQGSKFVTFRVASTDKWTDQEGQTHTVTDWVDCVFSNVNSGVIPYLKQGVKVFVRGNGSVRLYSSPKERKMKAGARVNVIEIELCGGSSDEVPRRLVEPETGALVEVTKHYWANLDTSKLEKDDMRELIDTQGRRYAQNKAGFVIPVPVESEAEREQVEADSNQSQE